MTEDGFDLVGLFHTAGRRSYGDRVSQLQHALQCAAQACRARADDEVVVAALLHDVGHLRAADGMSEGPATHHGTAGAAFLREYVPPRVAWLVEHHVVAKRYLVAVDPGYAATLSPASQRSLVAQGAGLPFDQAFALETHAWFGDAVRLRRWDDGAKVTGAVAPPLIEYRSLLERWFGLQRWTSAPGVAVAG